MKVKNEVREQQPQQWEAPGPGLWERDDSHTPGTIPSYMQALFPAALQAGFREYGVLVEGF